jgi:hypothetical protein
MGLSPYRNRIAPLSQSRDKINHLIADPPERVVVDPEVDRGDPSGLSFHSLSWFAMVNLSTLGWRSGMLELHALLAQANSRKSKTNSRLRRP